MGTMWMQSSYGTNNGTNTLKVGIPFSIQSFDKTFDYAKKSAENIKTNSYTKQKDTTVKESSYTKDKESTQQTDKIVSDKEGTHSVKKVEETTEDIEDDVHENQVEDQILNLVSQAFNLPIEEIKNLLGDMGLEVEDLINQEGFSTFIGEMLGVSDLDVVLTEYNDLSSITQLFDQLTALGDDTTESIEQDLGQAGIMSQFGITQSDEKLSTQQNEVNTTNISQETTQNRQLISSLESSQPGEGEANDTSSQGEDTGAQVPVHHLPSTTFTKTFQTESGMVMQTVSNNKGILGETFIEQIDFKTIGQTKELNIQLSPKELGDLNIKIIENNGVLVAEIKVDNEKAKQFILSEIHLLKENLVGEGLNIVDVKVDIRQDHHQSQMEQQKQKSSKRIQDIIDKHFNEIDEEEKIENVATISESEVDYTV